MIFTPNVIQADMGTWQAYRKRRLSQEGSLFNWVNFESTSFRCGIIVLTLLTSWISTTSQFGLVEKNWNCQFHICFSAWITIWQFHRILQFHMSTVMLIVNKFSKKSFYFITVQFFGVKWWKDEGREGKGIFVLIFLLTVSFWSKSFGRLKRTRG